MLLFIELCVIGLVRVAHPQILFLWLYRHEIIAHTKHYILLDVRILSLYLLKIVSAVLNSLF